MSEINDNPHATQASGKERPDKAKGGAGGLQERLMFKRFQSESAPANEEGKEEAKEATSLDS